MVGGRRTDMNTYKTEQCAICTAEFQKTRKDRMCCSRKCSGKYSVVKHGSYKKKRVPVNHPERPCTMCQGQFKPKHIDTQFCMACRAKRAEARTEAKRVGTVRAFKNTPEEAKKKQAARVKAYKKVVIENLCEQCGGNHMLQRHHDDYSKPLEVRILCRKCHLRWHAFNTAKL